MQSRWNILDFIPGLSYFPAFRARPDGEVFVGRGNGGRREGRVDADRRVHPLYLRPLLELAGSR
jgi:hypothetical protein